MQVVPAGLDDEPAPRDVPDGERVGGDVEVDDRALPGFQGDAAVRDEAAVRHGQPVRRGSGVDLHQLVDGPVAGVGAWEALRVAARTPRLGLDTDHRTLPHEVGWLTTAVHLDKGCYRGQETVARVHNLGRPPRRLVFLHLDGSGHTLPERGEAVYAGGERAVGQLTSVARHYEDGPIALALVKRSTDPSIDLVAGGVSAGQEVIVTP